MIGCQRQQDQPLTTAEAQDALDEVQTGSQAQALTSDSIEISTHFTIGDAVEKAADEVRSFVQTELPCADVALSGSTLTVQYGAHGTCLFHGHTFTGTHTISVSKNDAGEVVVDHVWAGLSNGKVEVDGTATVTWNLADPSRHVVHDLKWTRLSDSRTGEGHADFVQRPLNGDLSVGFTEDGSRTWDGQRGHWELDMNDLAMRWADPVPESGSITLVTPRDKTVTATFERKDATTIHVTFEAASRSIGFDVHSLP
jgi:hypothetical protein